MLSELCNKTISGSLFMILMSISWVSYAHHVLGRPSYSLDEDSTTPPALEMESQIGDFYISFMAFPAVPSPKEHGRINLHIAGINNPGPYVGNVTFKVRYDSFFQRGETVLGTQSIDDNVYRQGFVFEEAGDYIISAEFNANGEIYKVDMPLTVGKPVIYNTAALVITSVAILLFIFSLYKRRQLQRLQVKQHNQAQSMDTE